MSHNISIEKRSVLALIAVLALVFFAAACSAQPAAPAPEGPTPAAPTAAPAVIEAPTTAPLVQESPLQPAVSVSPLKPVVPQTYVPITSEECEGLRKSVSDLLKVEGQSETAGFRDPAADVNGQGCLITLRGTGVQFPNFVEVAQQLQAFFEGQGWRYDQAYAADSPTGTLFGMRKDLQLALVDVGWIAGADVKCPPDQPVSACDIKPEQQFYTVMVNVGQGVR